MPVNDPIADMLTRMRNAQHARKESCIVPWSKIKHGICEVLKNEKYLTNIELTGEMPRQEIVVTFDPEKTFSLKRESTPGRHIYLSANDVKPVLSGFGIAILSTSSGLMTDKEAREKKIGGELICTIS